MITQLLRMGSIFLQQRVNRKGVQMTINTIVVLIIALTFAAIVLYFVIKSIGGQLDVLGGVGSNASQGLTDIDLPGT